MKRRTRTVYACLSAGLTMVIGALLATPVTNANFQDTRRGLIVIEFAESFPSATQDATQRPPRPDELAPVPTPNPVPTQPAPDAPPDVPAPVEPSDEPIPSIPTTQPSVASELETEEVE